MESHILGSFETQYVYIYIPSGKLLHNYGKTPFLMGKPTISMAIFNSYVSLPEGNIYIYRFIIIWLYKPMDFGIFRFLTKPTGLPFKVI